MFAGLLACIADRNQDNRGHSAFNAHLQHLACHLHFSRATTPALGTSEMRYAELIFFAMSLGLKVKIMLIIIAFVVEPLLKQVSSFFYWNSYIFAPPPSFVVFLLLLFYLYC